MKTFKYLDLDEVIAIHFDQVNRYGGSHGIRDLNLLVSAVSRPQASFGGKDLYNNIFLKVASLFHSLALNHPFIDGNKRTSIVSAGRMLFINGYMLKSNQKEMVEIPIKIANKKMDIDEIADWLKKNSKKI